tara:strand:- start:8509 stop:8973 length:465 start_codon:yes stop_codon:yes gene_type:complete
MPTPVEQVFNVFTLYRLKIGKGKPTLSKSATTKINKAIAQVGLNDVLLIMDYLTNADDDYTNFINGNNDTKRFYGTFDNILRITKLEEKVRRARSWQFKEQRAKKNKAKDMFVPFQMVEREEYQRHLAKQFEEEEEEHEPQDLFNNKGNKGSRS